MLEKITGYFFNKEFALYGAFCGASLAAVTWVHRCFFQNREIRQEFGEKASFHVANFILLQSALSGNASFSGRFWKSVGWLGSREAGALIDQLPKPWLPEYFFSDIVRRIQHLFAAFLYPELGMFSITRPTDEDGARWVKILTLSCVIEILFRGLLQEVLLRQIPKKLFAFSHFIPPEWVDSSAFQIARVVLSSLISAFSSSYDHKKFWGIAVSSAYFGYLTETAGLGFSIVQRFSEYYCHDIKNRGTQKRSASTGNLSQNDLEEIKKLKAFNYLSSGSFISSQKNLPCPRT